MPGASGQYDPRDDAHQSNHSVYKDGNHEAGVLEGTFVEILPIGPLQVLLSRMEDEGERDEKQDEGATDAARVGDEDLGLLEEEHNDDHWDRNDDTPNSLNHSSVILYIIKISER